MPRFLMALLVLGCFASGEAFAATEPGCKPVRDADQARAARKTWHMHKTVQGTALEIVRIGDDVWNRMGAGPWTRMPPTMAKALDNAATQAESLPLSNCRKLGEETVGGIATTVYSFTTAAPGHAPVNGKVWIGTRDGLPYREEGLNTGGTTVYEGVKAPEVR